VNTVRGGAIKAVEAVVAGGRLATITGDPPPAGRGISVSNIYVRADGARLQRLAAALARGELSLHVGSRLPLAEAASALQLATAGRGAGAIVLTIEAISSWAGTSRHDQRWWVI
jgi:NADPH:quinone reductase-like Zn-dependent oxidoreductase